MRYWLIKSEPGAWSWDDQCRDQVTHWDGVKNYQARNNMMQMKLGDLVYFYHSVSEKRIMGVVEVVKEHYPDPDDPRFCWVDVKVVEPLKNPVNLAQIKAEESLQDIALVKQSRLSVMPLTEKEWYTIKKMSEGK